MNRKGNMDSFTIITGLFVISAAVIGLLYAFQEVVTSGAFASSSDATGLINNGATMLTNIGNEGFAFIAIGLILFNIIASFLLLTHPIFAIIDLFLFPITWWVAAIMSNAYESSLYTISSAAGLDVMNFIMLNLVTIMVVADIVTAIVTYATVKE